MTSVFTATTFQFPYKDLKFPGQYTEEKILFITREGKYMLHLRWLFVCTASITVLLFTLLLGNAVQAYLPSLANLIIFTSLPLTITLTLTGLWWTYTLWKKSLFIITTRRLTKFIHTTPWNRYQLSLGLNQIVDTGAYQKGFFQAIFKYGYFVARSAAGNIKNFKIVNISFAEDLHNYINKLLFTFNKEKDRLDMFRPFIPHLKGEAREQFVKQTAPEYAKK